MKHLLLLSFLAIAYGHHLSRRVVNGEPAEDGQFPFIVSIRNSGVHNCGGSIISSRWVLTASHCNVTSNFTILAGTTSQNAVGHLYRIFEVIDHGDFDFVSPKNDITLLLTSKEIKFDKFVKPITPINIRNVHENEIYVTAGWGMLDSETKEYAVVLQYVNVEVISLETCQQIYKENEMEELIPWDKQICTFGANGSGPCDRDSGGPLVSSSGHLVGILSYGSTGPCGQILPDVFTKVSSYVQWIKQHINDK